MPRDWYGCGRWVEALEPRAILANVAIPINPAAHGKAAAPLSALVPPPPTDVWAGDPTAKTIRLSWTDVATDETAYEVERSEFGNWQFATVATLPTDSVSYVDSGLSGGRTYTYRVRAINGVGPGGYSGEASATTTLGDAPAAPANLVAAAADSGPSTIELTWTYQGPNAWGYELARATVPGGPFVTVASITGAFTSYRDEGLAPATTYYYEVRATNVWGASGYSNVASATTPPPDTDPPTASVSLPGVTVAGGTSYWFRVNYSDPSGLDASTFDDADVLVTGPSGFSQRAALDWVEYDIGPVPTARSAEYALVPPGGVWTAGYNGTYTFYLNAGQVKDNLGNAVPGRVLGTMTVAIPKPPRPTSGPSTATISGAVFVDANGNGTRERRETTPLPATLFLDVDGNGYAGVGEPLTSCSRKTGAFVFAGVAPGTYQLREIPPPGFRQSLPRKYYTITVAAGGTSAGWVFGDTTLGYVQGLVWLDANANTGVTRGEPGLAGWRAFIDGNGDGVWQKRESSVLTDANGYFVFSAVPSGTVTLRVQPVKGYTATSRTAQTLTIGSGQVYTKLGFGQRV